MAQLVMGEKPTSMPWRTVSVSWCASTRHQFTSSRPIVVGHTSPTPCACHRKGAFQSNWPPGSRSLLATQHRKVCDASLAADYHLASLR